MNTAEASLGGTAGSQTPTRPNADRDAAGWTPSQSAQHQPRRYLGLMQIAEKFGVSERTAHKIITEPWFPAAVDLSPRVRRWIEHEVDSAAVARAPRRTEREAEPENLLRGKVERLKRAGAPT